MMGTTDHTDPFFQLALSKLILFATCSHPLTSFLQLANDPIFEKKKKKNQFLTTSQ